MSGSGSEDWKRIAVARRASTGQLLLRCARLLDERAVARINSAGIKPRLRPAHTRLFPHIDVAGTRLTELARRVGITKQAVGQLVDELVSLGALELAEDPDDRRARLVRFSPGGVAAIEQGLGVLAGLEKEVTRRVGRGRMKALHETLLLLSDALDEIPLDDAQTSGTETDGSMGD